MDADLDHTDPIENEFSALRTEPITTSYAERLLQLKSTSKHFHDRSILENAEYMKNVKSARDKESIKSELTFIGIKESSVEKFEKDKDQLVATVKIICEIISVKKDKNDTSYFRI